MALFCTCVIHSFPLLRTSVNSLYCFFLGGLTGQIYFLIISSVALYGSYGSLCGTYFSYTLFYCSCQVYCSLHLSVLMLFIVRLFASVYLAFVLAFSSFGQLLFSPVFFFPFPECFTVCLERSIVVASASWNLSHPGVLKLLLLEPLSSCYLKWSPLLLVNLIRNTEYCCGLCWTHWASLHFEVRVYNGTS